MKYKAQIGQDEEDLLAEMDRLVTWMVENKRYMSILLSAKQFKTFKRLCGRISEHSALIDRYQRITQIDKERLTFRGFKVDSELEGRRHTKKDLMELPL